jgi:hypothetical protein
VKKNIPNIGMKIHIARLEELEQNACGVSAPSKSSNFIQTSPGARVKRCGANDITARTYIHHKEKMMHM